MWSRKIDARIVAEEEPFLRLASRTGQLGCVCSFIICIFSIFLDFWVDTILASEGPFDWILYSSILEITNRASFISVALMAIGFFVLLRSNLSALALPYVFLSLIGYTFSWSFLFSLGFDYTIISVLSAAEYITITLIQAWILWSVIDTVSDRGLLRNIVVLKLALLAYYYPFVFLVQVFFLPADFLVHILLRVPPILLYLMQIALSAWLFRQDQLIVIDDEIRPVAGSERL